MKKAKLILLRRMKYREADLILSGLSSTGEKLSFIARSAIKSRKRFGGGVLEPTHYISATYRDNAAKESLFSLNEASLINPFSGLKTDFDRLELALHMVKMVDRLTKDGDVDLKNLFDLLGNSLKAAEMSESLDLLKSHFEIKLTAYLGVLPDWQEVQPFISKPITEHASVEASIKDTALFSQKMYRYLEDQLQVRLG